MDLHYNAFISYRHHPEDIRVATQIHRALERYRIPRAVRKKQKGSLRLFRDKDELPITSNLTDDITRALENSDFLIVICSTHTKESIWVQREIETFLKTHTYDKVLTVLVDGEPYDTIPEILQYREEADPDTGEMERILIEPLSCDWRVGKKAAYREELPRLAAALLHCGYDELRQRQRQYKMRRMVTFFSLALAASVSLMAYFLYTSIKIQQANDMLHEANEEIREANVQIQNNLDEALRNQSEYLASAAGKLYDSGDTLTAVSIAMAALPSETNDRPYVADAEKVLSEILGLYSAKRDIVAAGAFNAGALVSEFAVSEDGGVIYLLDQNKRVTAWDTASYEQLGSFSLSANYVNKMQVVDGMLVVSMSVGYSSGDPELCCYDRSGKLLWSVSKCSDFAVLDGNAVMVLRAVPAEPTIIEFLDAATGKRERDDFVISESGELSPGKFYQDHYVSGLPLVLSDSEWMGSYSEQYIVKADLESGAVAVIKPYEHWDEEIRDTLRVTGAAVTEQGNVLVMIGDESGFYNGKFNNVITTSPAYGTLLCYSGEDSRLLWKTVTTAYSYSKCFTLCSITGTDKIFCQAGNAFFVIDEVTGEIISNCECTSNVLSVRLDQDSAYGIMDDGYFFSYSFETNACQAMLLMEGSFIQGALAKGYYFLEELSHQVTLCKPSPETGWTALESNAGKISVNKKYKDGNLMALLTYGNELLVLDIQSREILSRIPVEGSYRLQLLGFSEDKTKLYYTDKSGIMTLDIASGEVVTSEIRSGLGDDSTVTGFFGLEADTFFHMTRQDRDLYLTEVNLKTGEQIASLLHKDADGDSWSLGSKSGVVVASPAFAWLWDAGTLYEFDRESKSFRVLLEGVSDYPLCQYHPEKDILSVCLKDAILFWKPGGDQILSIPQPEHKPVCVKLYQDDILTVNGEAKLIRYDWQGRRLSETPLHVYNTFYNNIDIDCGETVDIDWNFTQDGELVLGMINMGNIVECTQWRGRAYIEYYEAYDPKADAIICSYDSQLGCYPRYTTRQVLEIAREQLGNYELPDDTKAFYGID